MKPLTLAARRIALSLAAALFLGLLGTAPASSSSAGGLPVQGIREATPQLPVSDPQVRGALNAIPRGHVSDEVTLEQLFPREGMVSPIATGIALSADGRFAAYLYRPHAERSPWNDLWIRDLATGKTLRLSPVFLKNPAAAELHRGDYFTWSPAANELLYLCGEKLYRWKEGDAKLTPETAIEGMIGEAQYLPDGSGYTSLGKGTLRQVVFGQPGSNLFPLQVPAGESPYRYHVSPDGRRLVLLTYRKGYQRGSDRQVWIATYQGRFMVPRSVVRPLAEDPQAPQEINVYVAELRTGPGMAGATRKVFHHSYTGPGDVLSDPSWSPDSRKAAFSVFEQTTRKVWVLQLELGSLPVTETKLEQVYSFLHTGGPTTPGMIQPVYLEDSCRLVFLTEQSGFRHLHVLDPRVNFLEPLTTGRFEVYPLALSPDRHWYYVAATREDPACRDLYRVSLTTGQMERLSTARGVYGDVFSGAVANIAVSADGRTVLANYACFGTTERLVRIDVARGTQETLLDYYPEHIQKYTRVRPEFFTYRNRHGQEIRGYLFKPRQWQATDKRPLLIYVYGGPLGISKIAVEGNHQPDAYYFAYYMAARHGYITCVIDPRGSSGYGADFEKANFGKPGQAQVEDLVDGVQYLVKNHGVDPKRVGIHGWSFGGFQTQMCMYTAPEVFAVGIAGAGPTQWENYNSWYTTGTIGASRKGQPDLGKFSLLPLAKNLKGRLLLVHGMQDTNVLFQDTIKVYQALLHAGKGNQVELLLDPTGDHWLRGDVSLLTRFRKYEEFLVRHLGEGRPGSSPAQ